MKRNVPVFVVFAILLLSCNSQRKMAFKEYDSLMNKCIDFCMSWKESAEEAEQSSGNVDGLILNARRYMDSVALYSSKAAQVIKPYDTVRFKQAGLVKGGAEMGVKYANQYLEGVGDWNVVKASVYSGLTYSWCQDALDGFYSAME